MDGQSSPTRNGSGDPLVAYEDDCDTDEVHHPYTAWNQGFDAGEEEIMRELNPYKEGSREYHAWDDGWEHGADEALE